MLYKNKEKLLQRLDEKVLGIFKNHKVTYTKHNDGSEILYFKQPNTNCYGMVYLFCGNTLAVSGDLGCAVYELTWKATLKSFLDGFTTEYFHSKLEAYDKYNSCYDFSKEKAIEELSDYSESWLFADNDDYDKYNDLDDKNRKLDSIRSKLLSLLAESNVSENNSKATEIKEDIKSLDSMIEENKETMEELACAKGMEAKNRMLEIIESSCNVEEFQYSMRSIESEIVELTEDYDMFEWAYNLGNAVPTRVKYHLAGLYIASNYIYGEKGSES